MEKIIAMKVNDVKIRITENDLCVSCGRYVPEGYMICNTCEKGMRGGEKRRGIFKRHN